MSYSRSPNVLDYIANLNTIPSAQEMKSNSPDNFNMKEDLAMFSNAQFFNFDLGHDADLQQTTFEPPIDLTVPLQGDFQFDDFNNYSTVLESSKRVSDSVSNTVNSTIAQYQTASSLINSSPSVADKVKVFSVTSSSSPNEVIETSRQAAEEDKRRRNTAASARFRVKKKQREQALEKSAKEMCDKVSKLEERINVLETENKWLKDLITEKNNGIERDIWADFEGFWKKYTEQRIASRRAGAIIEQKPTGDSARQQHGVV